MKLLVWGIGQNCEEYIENGNENFLMDEYLIGGIDSNSEKQKNELRGKPIYAPNEINGLNYDWILIGSYEHEADILKQAESLGLKDVCIPFNIWHNYFFAAFDDALLYSLESENVSQIMKWNKHIRGGMQSLIQIKNNLGKKAILTVIPYGAFGKNFCKGNINISDLQFGVVYDGEYQRSNSYEIPLRSNNVIVQIILPKHTYAFLKVKILHDEISNALDKISHDDVRMEIENGIDEINRYGYHDEDYSFLEAFNDMQGYTIFDIGANIGQSAISFLKTCSANVISFEPNPNCIQALQTIKCLFGNTRMKIIHSGVGEKSGEFNFYVPKIDNRISQEASFSKESAVKRVYAITSRMASDEDLVTFSVPIIPIDETEINFEKLFFVKIDVEGYEIPAIKGMKQTIEKYRPILLLEVRENYTKEEAIRIVNEFSHYDIWYWDYMDCHFYRENHRGGINYFLLPTECRDEKINQVMNMLKMS